MYALYEDVLGLWTSPIYKCLLSDRTAIAFHQRTFISLLIFLNPLVFNNVWISIRIVEFEGLNNACVLPVNGFLSNAGSPEPSLSMYTSRPLYITVTVFHMPGWNKHKVCFNTNLLMFKIKVILNVTQVILYYE